MEFNTPAPGDVFGHYRIEEKLGGGTFGTVFRARDVRLDREVAIKILHTQESQDETTLGMLLQEGRAASALNHPNICAIYDVGEEGGLHYIAMEYVEGWTLAELVEAGPLPVEKALSYIAQMAHALAHAHSRGIIHRDLKASNVVITADSQAKLLDFGLARRLDSRQIEAATQSRQSLADIGGLAGTLSYMAPEVLRGKAADAASDLWSLGALLYQMLSGVLPFKGETPFELSVAIMVEEAPPLPPEIPHDVRTIVERCLDKDPGKRYADGAELARRLEAARAELDGERSGGAVRRRSRVLVAVAVLVAIIAVAAAWRFLERQVPAPATPTITVTQAPDVAQPTPQNPPGSTQKPPATKTPQPKTERRYPGNPEVVVWVNTKSGIYHCPGSRWYKNTADGLAMPQRQAQERGYRPASAKPCE